MKEIIECVNPKNINNITLTKGYEKIYRYLSLSLNVKYKEEDTGVILDEKKLINKINTEIKSGIIHNDSGIANNNIDVILYYNSFITIKYNDCCEKKIYFPKYEEALEYFDKLNDKLGFINFLNL